MTACHSSLSTFGVSLGLVGFHASRWHGCSCLSYNVLPNSWISHLLRASTSTYIDPHWDVQRPSSKKRDGEREGERAKRDGGGGVRVRFMCVITSDFMVEASQLFSLTLSLSIFFSLYFLSFLPFAFLFLCFVSHVLFSPPPPHALPTNLLQSCHRVNQERQSNFHLVSS